VEQLWVSNAGRDNPNGGEGMRPGDWIVPDKRPMNVLSLLLETRLSSVRRYLLRTAVTLRISASSSPPTAAGMNPMTKMHRTVINNNARPIGLCLYMWATFFFKREPEPTSLVCVVLALMMGRRRAVRRRTTPGAGHQRRPTWNQISYHSYARSV